MTVIENIMKTQKLKIILLFIILSGCINNNQLREKFHEFYTTINLLDDSSAQISSKHLENDAPAMIKHFKTKEGDKYVIAFAGALSKKEYRYFIKDPYLLAEVITSSYNKPFYVKDSVPFQIIHQDTIRALFKNDQLMVFGDTIVRQPNEEYKRISKQLLSTFSKYIEQEN